MGYLSFYFKGYTRHMHPLSFRQIHATVRDRYGRVEYPSIMMGCQSVIKGCSKAQIMMIGRH